MASNFVDTRAATFHSAFSTASTLNADTLQYEAEEVQDLRQTLEYSQQRAARYIDFTQDLSRCSWETVLSELDKAKEAAEKSKGPVKNPLKWAYRTAGKAATILEPGLQALPDNLSVLHGGLAVVFSLARHDHINRVKILGAFEMVPDVIVSARDKEKTFPKDRSKPKNMQLHDHIEKLQEVLLRVIPALINLIIPGTFVNIIKSPFRGYKIDQLLAEIKTSAEAVRTCVESLMEDIAVQHFSTSLSIEAQVAQIFRSQRELHMSIQAAQSKTDLFQYFMQEISSNGLGVYPGQAAADATFAGKTMPNCTADGLLNTLDVNHLEASHDSFIVVKRGQTLQQADVERAASMMTTPQVRDFLGNSGPSVIAIDGHFDRAQMGRVSPMSYTCAMLSQALRQLPASSDAGALRASIVLQYFCTMHVQDTDDLKGPQGMMRSLTAQLLFALVAGGWVGIKEVLKLPHLRDGEEDALAQLNLAAICRLFGAIVRLVPKNVTIYCIVDGFSALEQDELWRPDYDAAIDGFREAIDASDPKTAADFRLLIASTTRSRLLPDDFIMPGRKVSLLRGSAVGKSLGRGGFADLAKAASQ